MRYHQCNAGSLPTEGKIGRLPIARQNMVASLEGKMVTSLEGKDGSLP